MKKTRQKNEAKKAALEKIRANIEGIYKNEKILQNIEALRHDICIPPGLYDSIKNEVEKLRSIHLAINLLKEKWIEFISRDKRIKEVITKYLLIYNIMFDFEGEDLSTTQVKNWSNIKSERYLGDVIDNFIQGKNWTYEIIKINSKIWKSVISTMLFNIPKETVIRLKESILKDYVPKVHEDLTIEFHELTKMGDFLLVEDKIKLEQKRYEKKFNYSNSKRNIKLPTVKNGG
ncbi:MAG: hypothetical protein WC415_03275 [Patescibacteria group bacterium]|jgi:hypothetical protein